MTEFTISDVIELSDISGELIQNTVTFVRAGFGMSSPPGIRISGRAFGREWRYPITSGSQFPQEIRRSGFSRDRRGVLVC